jgi:hypothetical protein
MYLIIDKVTRELFAIEVTDPGNAYPNHWVAEVESIAEFHLCKMAKMNIYTNMLEPYEPGTIFTVQDLLELRRKAIRRRRVRFLRDTASLLDADSPLTVGQKASLRILRSDVFNLDLTDPGSISFPELPTALKEYLGE